jgi:hypothetical protein
MTTIKQVEEDENNVVALPLKPPWPTAEEMRKAEDDEQRRKKGVS